MDPKTGQIYDLSDPTIPDDVRERLVPISEKSFFDQEVAEIQEILDEVEKIKEEPEVFRPVMNRQEKRAAQRRRDREQKFINRHGGKPGYANG